MFVSLNIACVYLCVCVFNPLLGLTEELGLIMMCGQNSAEKQSSKSYDVIQGNTKYLDIKCKIVYSLEL